MICPEKTTTIAVTTESCLPTDAVTPPYVRSLQQQTTFSIPATKCPSFYIVCLFFLTALRFY